MNSGNGARRESDEEEVEKFSNFEGRKKKFKGCPRKKDFNFKFKNKNDEKKFF